MNPVSIVVQLLQFVAGLIPTLVGGASATTITQIITILEQAIPLAVQVGEDLVAPITNIIAALKTSGAVTADQLNALDTLEASLDAAFNAAAAADAAADAAASGTPTPTASGT